MMNGVPAPMVGFARLGLVLVLGIALWKPVDDLAPAVIDAADTVEEPASVDTGTNVLAQDESGNSLLMNFADAVDLDDSIDIDSRASGPTLVR